MKKLLYNTLAFLFVLGSANKLHATDYFFNVTSGDWDVASNWSPVGVPGAGDNAWITNSRSVTLSSTVYINNLTIGSLYQSGTINGNFDINVAGILDCSQGNSFLIGTGTISVSDLTKCPIDYCAPWPCELRLDGKTLIMNGGGSIGALGTITFLNNGLLRNPAGAVFTVTSGVSPFTRIGTASFLSGTFENQGTVNHTGDLGSRTIIYVPFNNSGTVNVNNGSEMIINGGGIEQNATININNNSVFSFSQTGTNTISSTTFTGTGWLASNHPSVTMPAGNTINCRLKIAGSASGSLFVDQIGISPIEFYASGTYTRAVSTTMNTGNFTLSGGTYIGDNDINISGTLVYTGTFDGVAGTINATGLTTFSGFSILGGKVLNMNGGCNYAGQLDLKNNAIIRNQVGQFFTGYGTIKDFSSSSTGTFENLGTINKSNASDLNIGCNFNNIGTVNLTNGNINMIGSSTHNGANVSIATGCTYGFGGGFNHTLSNSIFSGDGNFQVGGTSTTLTLQSSNTFSCRYKQTGGTTTDQSGISPIEFNQTGGIYNRTVSSIMNTGNATIQGECNGNFDANITGTLLYQYGVISGTGRFDVTGLTTISATAILDTKTLVMNGGCALNSGIDLNNNAVLRNPVGAVLTPANGITIYSGGTFENMGTVQQNTAGAFNTSCNFSNSGILNIQQGFIIAGGAGIVSNSGTIKGNGTLQIGNNVTYTNTGTFSPGQSPGTLNHTGMAYTNSTLDFEIQESGGVVTKDLLNVTGNMTLGGTLNILYLSGNVPLGTYDIATCTGTRTGTFATINYPANCNGNCSVVYTSNKAQLVLSAVLPLELLSFELVPVKEDILLRWKTASEEHIRNFEIERSTDSQNWTTINTQPARNVFTEENTYQFTDTNISDWAKNDDYIYYRLKINDLDGETSYSPIKNTHWNTRQNIQVWPNPAHEQVQLTYSGSSESEQTIRILDMAGRVCYTETQVFQKGVNTFSINIADLGPGVYCAQIGTEQVVWVKR